MSKSPWGNIGAWAAEAEREEQEEREEAAKAAAEAATRGFSGGGDSKNYPSLKDSVSSASKQTKKKTKMTLQEFNSQNAYGSGTASTQPGLTHEDMLRLPTGPKERSAGDEMQYGGRLGGGFSNYGTRSGMGRMRDRDSDGSDGSWGGSRRSYGGFEDAQLPGTTQDHLQIFNIEAKAKMKSYQMPEQVVFWKWITPKMLGLVTQTSVFHWSIDGDSEPVKMFDRTANLSNNQIINYRCDASEKWLVLIGIAPGSPERPQLVKGSMQLFSVDQQRSQALEAHAASFASFRVPGNDKDSILISFATKTSNAGQVVSKLLVIELGAQPGKPSFTKKQADLFFPPDFADDFPVAMQISQKYKARTSVCV